MNLYVTALKCLFLITGFHIQSIKITAIQSASTLIAVVKEKIIFICGVEVTCSGLCDSTIITFQWVKDGSIVFDERNEEVSLAETSPIHQEKSIINRQMAVSDAGSYHCQAKLSEMPLVNSSTPVNISVTSKCSGISRRCPYNLYELLHGHTHDTGYITKQL